MKVTKLHTQYLLLGTVAFLFLVAAFIIQQQRSSNPKKNIFKAFSQKSSPLAALIPSFSPQSTPEKTISPSQVLDLTNWKLTLPTGLAGKPTEIKQTELTKYENNPWFVVRPEGDGVQFRAPVNGVTTKGSKYPRSELREMTNNGTEPASWSSTKGVHTMFLEEAITVVPVTKRHVVAGQIHDDTHDILVIRLEYPNLYVNVDGDNVIKLDSNYALGKRFKVKLVVKEGKTDVFYNDSAEPVYTLGEDYSDAYFKAGDYTQSNCTKEGNALCKSGNYGEVVIYQAKVTHE